MQNTCQKVGLENTQTDKKFQQIKKTVSANIQQAFNKVINLAESQIYVPPPSKRGKRGKKRRAAKTTGLSGALNKAIGITGKGRSGGGVFKLVWKFLKKHKKMIFEIGIIAMGVATGYALVQYAGYGVALNLGATLGSATVGLGMENGKFKPHHDSPQAKNQQKEADFQQWKRDKAHAAKKKLSVIV